MKKKNGKKRKDDGRTNVAVTNDLYASVQEYSKRTGIRLRFIIEQALILWKEKNGIA